MPVPQSRTEIPNAIVCLVPFEMSANPETTTPAPRRNPPRAVTPAVSGVNRSSRQGPTHSAAATSNVEAGPASANSHSSLNRKTPSGDVTADERRNIITIDDDSDSEINPSSSLTSPHDTITSNPVSSTAGKMPKPRNKATKARATKRGRKVCCSH